MSDKWETIVSNHGRNYYNLEFWERTCKVSVGIHRQARAGELGLLIFEDKMTWKTKSIVHIEDLCVLKKHWWKVRVGVSGFWHSKIFDMTSITRIQTISLVILNFSAYQKSLLEKSHVVILNQGKPFTHWSKMTGSTRDRLHNSSCFQNQHTHYQIDFAFFINNGGWTWKTKWIQHNIYIFISISISISCVCRLGYCTTFAKWQGWYTICWDNWGTKQQIKQLQENWLGSIVSNIEHCQQMQAGGRMFWGHQRRWVWPQQTT